MKPHGEKWFRKTGGYLGKLARTFIDRGQAPPEELRPTLVPEKVVPRGMSIDEAQHQTAYY